MIIDNWILIGGIVLFIAVFASKLMSKFGVPTLVIFVTLGMLMGSEGIGGIAFEDYGLTRQIAEIALIVILFSGGFGTAWGVVKRSAPMAGVLSSAGVVLTAMLVGLFAWLVFDLSILESFLLGAIISSTDAAAVFTILKTRNLNLRSDLAATLELESGSNDPFAYILTILFIAGIQGTAAGFGGALFLQLLVGSMIGVGIGYLGMMIINKIHLSIDGLYFIIAAAIVMLSFGLATILEGNGFLAVYLTGMVLGNHPLTHKISLVKFFDGMAWLMQILLFFTLGLLVFPSQVIAVFWQGLAVALFLSFIARPLAVFAIMSLFRKPWKDQALVSWVGFRGAASIVFAIYPLVYGLASGPFLFNIVFFVAFFSVLIQGMSLIPLAKRLGLTETSKTTLTTFTDYRGDTYADLLGVKIPEDSDVVGKTIMELDIPERILIVMIKRGKAIVTPRGSTELHAGDVLMLASDSKQELLDIAHMEQFQSAIKKRTIPEIDGDSSS
jgi:potassium/hydrogen antiporter